MEAAFWERRLFKNTFTYPGRRREVNGGAVKLQLFGKRTTFSLQSSHRKEAALEACQIYQTIHTQGWEAIGQGRGRSSLLGLLPAEADSATVAFRGFAAPRSHPDPSVSTTATHASSTHLIRPLYRVPAHPGAP